jgi:hypothetical protein
MATGGRAGQAAGNDYFSGLAAPAFGGDRNSFIWLSGYDGAKYQLFKSTWEFKTLHLERAHLAQNFDLIKDTLKNPEFVRLSEKDKDCFLAYREYDDYVIVNDGHRNFSIKVYLAVVVDRAKGRISTFYPCEKPKPGTTIWPLETQK